MARRKRTYSEADVTRALAAYVRAGSFRAAETETGVPWETIRDWAGHRRWTSLLDDVRWAHAEEIQRLWSASARDAAEGLQEAVLRCRQGLRSPGLTLRDAALIGRTLTLVLATAQRLGEPEDNQQRQVQVHVYPTGSVPVLEGDEEWDHAH